MTYEEQLNHPFWQRKRLEIFQRDDFTCLDCGNKDRQLHVHHGYYERRKTKMMAWEYDNDTMHTLCDECHNKMENIKTAIYKEIAKFPVIAHPSVYFELATLIKSKTFIAKL